jgi:hypothetical protein
MNAGINAIPRTGCSPPEVLSVIFVRTMDAPDAAKKPPIAPDNGLPLPEQYIVGPAFDQQFREWIAAEAAVFMAIEHGSPIDGSNLAQLSADALEKHRLLWAGADALSARLDENSSSDTGMRISRESGLHRKR